MSRYYQYEVRVQHRGAPEGDLKSIVELFAASVSVEDREKDITTLAGLTNLCAGQTEEEAHDDISKAVKVQYPDAKVRSIWTCLEYLPSEEYGDTLSGVE